MTIPGKLQHLMIPCQFDEAGQAEHSALEATIGWPSCATRFAVLLKWLKTQILTGLLLCTTQAGYNAHTCALHR